MDTFSFMFWLARGVEILHTHCFWASLQDRLLLPLVFNSQWQVLWRYLRDSNTLFDINFDPLWSLTFWTLLNTCVRALVDEGPAEVFILLRVRFRRDVWIMGWSRLVIQSQLHVIWNAAFKKSLVLKKKSLRMLKYLNKENNVRNYHWPNFYYPLPFMLDDLINELVCS